MKFNQRTVGIAAVTALMLGGLGIGIMRAEAGNSILSPQAGNSIKMPSHGLLADNDAHGANEAPDPQHKPAISAGQAEAAVLKANPGANAVNVKLEKEQGSLLYEVKLNNGKEVHVDANNGNVMGNETEEPEGR